MQDGVIEQVGALDELFFSPRDRKVAEYLGSPNVLECRSVLDLGHGLVEVDCGGLPVVVPRNGKEIRRMVVLPRDVLVSCERPASDVNVFAGTIRQIRHVDGTLLAQVEVDGHLIAAEVPRIPFEGSRMGSGSKVFVELRLTTLRVASDDHRGREAWSWS